MKKNKKDIISITIIIMFVMLFVVLITNFFSFNYGSTTDWDCQHWLIPDYFRKQFYATGNIFSNLAPNIGDGQNIYYLSYYGYLSPIILLSYLLPFVPMKLYIEVASIIGLMVTGIVFYFWMKKKYNPNISLIMTLLLISSTPLLFHSHRHVMYICYMPFLIMAFMQLDKNFANQKTRKMNYKLIILIFLMVMCNYFFAVSALATLCLYELHLLYVSYAKDRKNKLLKKEILCFCGEVGIALLSSMVLLLPTLSVILDGRSKSNVIVNLKDIILPNFKVNKIFYQAYSSGLTVLSFIAVIYSLKDKKNRLLSICLLAALFFPFISYILNGTMYVENKVLIPIIPLLIYITGYFLNDFYNKKIDINYYVIGIISTLFLIVMNLNAIASIGIIVELIIISICILFRKHNKIIFIYSIMLCFGMMLANTQVDRLVLATKKVINYSVPDIDFVDKYNYRITTEKDVLLNINNVDDINHNIGSIYSSTSNKNYKEYYYEFGVEVSQRSYGKISSTNNTLFNLTNSNKYLYALSPRIGYKKLEGTKNIYYNDDTPAIGRVGLMKMSKREFESLKYPYNMEALYKYIIVDEDIEDVFSTDVEEYKSNIAILSDIKTKEIKQIPIENSYKLEYFEKTSKTVKLPNINDNKILFISFDVDSIKCPNKDIKITINGERNVLPCASWKYHNRNNTFHYSIDYYPEKGLNITFTNGVYNLKNLKIYMIDYANISRNLKNIHSLDLKIIRNKNNLITTQYNSDTENEMVYLQIPYDKGYNITINGEKVEYFNVNNGMIGFDLVKGTNDIKIEFNAPLLNLSKIISLCGITMLIFVIISTKKRKKY